MKILPFVVVGSSVQRAKYFLQTKCCFLGNRILNELYNESFPFDKVAIKDRILEIKGNVQCGLTCKPFFEICNSDLFILFCNHTNVVSIIIYAYPHKV
mgnify:CR=1 FL=1